MAGSCRRTEAALSAQQLLTERGLRPEDSLLELWSTDLPAEVADLVYRPVAVGAGLDVTWAENLINESDWPLLPNLVPIMPVDDRSFACVVLSDDDGPDLPGRGSVVRWHLDVKDPSHQAGLLDTDCLTYVRSVAEELRHRETGKDLVFDIGEAYQQSFLAIDKRPRDFIVRPVRIACQNVIVALAAFSHDSAFDGLGVVAWQTCEVPHVATNEANRALTALMLCDAFKSGGTMEVRFDRPARATGIDRKIPGHPEGRVPAALRRFARTVGVEGLPDDATSISPPVARQLFRAVTPMPDDLRHRVDDATEYESIPPERLYFALMTGTWHPVELDFMLATSARTLSIVSGGAPWTERADRQAESEICRSALMASMFYSRVNNRDSAGSQSARVVEDDRQGVVWHADERSGSIEFVDLDPTMDIPWISQWPTDVDRRGSTLTVVPRGLVTSSAIDAVLSALETGPSALLVPRDNSVSIPPDIPVLRCPDRVADLDKTIEAKLLTSRIARA
jgi:hypothetical protein